MKVLVYFRELTDVSVLKKFIHLRFVDISRNSIKDISPLSSMSHLLTLNANQNAISFVNLDILPYLQNASFVRNKIQTTEGLNHPMLESLSLNCKSNWIEYFQSDMAIQTIYFSQQKHPNVVKTSFEFFVKLSYAWLDRSAKIDFLLMKHLEPTQSVTKSFKLDTPKLPTVPYCVSKFNTNVGE